MKNLLYIVIFLIILNLLISAFLVQKTFFPTNDDLRKVYYTTQVATLVSPHTLRELILHGENPYVIVDVREKEDYLKGHIVGAINIVPGETMINSFKKLQSENIGKEILIYCYTEVCMRGRKVGKELIKNGISVMELGIGYNEWENFWKHWNYPNEWDSINIYDYIRYGDEPGRFKTELKLELKLDNCSVDQKFGC